MPQFDEMFNELIEALKLLGGSGTNSEIEERVSELMNLSEAQVNKVHRGNRTQFSYRLAWTRNYLKNYGLLENSSRGVWSLTKKGRTSDKVKSSEVKQFVRKVDTEHKSIIEGVGEGNTPEDIDEVWQDKLIDEMLSLTPSAFEKLCQRILRESGFIEVEVTGKSGDGGIDGKGIVKINGLLGFNIIFQCKRYVGTIGSKEIRDFRGAMVGRADKGLFITTGTFTRDAKQEATRDGAPPIDLIDGNLLAEKMKELELGIIIEVKEVIAINKDWFKQF